MLVVAFIGSVVLGLTAWYIGDKVVIAVAVGYSIACLLMVLVTRRRNRLHQEAMDELLTHITELEKETKRSLRSMEDQIPPQLRRNQ